MNSTNHRFVKIKLFERFAGVTSYTATFNVLDFPAGCVPVTTVTAKDEADMANYPSVTKPTRTHRILKKVGHSLMIFVNKRNTDNVLCDVVEIV